MQLWVTKKENKTSSNHSLKIYFVCVCYVIVRKILFIHYLERILTNNLMIDLYCAAQIINILTFFL